MKHKSLGLILLLIVIFLIFIIYYHLAKSKEILIYTALKPSYWEIYLIDHNQTQTLTHGPGIHYNPAFSPDGKWLVFTIENARTGSLYTLDLTNPNAIPKRLTNGNHFEDAATFSPDGKTIYFVSTRDGSANIFKIPFNPEIIIQQSQAVNLTKNNNGNFNPAVSPDGKWIAFSSNRNKPAYLITTPNPPVNYRSTNIYIMKTDGSQLKQLTSGKNWEGAPAWSADGNFIYFYKIAVDIPQIYKMNADGTRLTRISPNKIAALSPAIKPDGRIAFSAKINNKWVIASVKPDGTAYQLETHAKQAFWAPTYDVHANRLAVYGQATQKNDLFYSEVPGGIYMGKPMATGPFLVSHEKFDLDHQLIDVYAVRGYFPNYISDTNKIISIEKFSKIVSSNPDGSEMKAIYASNNAYMIGISISPDKKWVTASLGIPFLKKNAAANIAKIMMDSGSYINLNSNSTANNIFPRYTPDSKHIIFSSNREGNNSIYIMKDDGTDVKRLTFDGIFDTTPSVSSSGDKILFASVRNGENYRIYMLDLNSDGSPAKLTKLTNGPGADLYPFFSPDNKWIIYASERDGLKDESPLIPIFNPQSYLDLYALRLSDKKIIRITDDKWTSILPFWSTEK